MHWFEIFLFVCRNPIKGTAHPSSPRGSHLSDVHKNKARHDTMMAYRIMQRLRKYGRPSYSSADSLASVSSHESEGPCDGAQLPGTTTSPPETPSYQTLENTTTRDTGARLKSERNEKGLHNIVKTASIPVHLEKVKNGGKGSYMLRMDDDLRQLLSQSSSAGGVNGKKRRAKFTDVGCAPTATG